MHRKNVSCFTLPYVSYFHATSLVCCDAVLVCSLCRAGESAMFVIIFHRAKQLLQDVDRVDQVISSYVLAVKEEEVVSKLLLYSYWKYRQR